MLPLLPELHDLSQCEARVQGAPHVSQSLLVSSLHIHTNPGDALAMTTRRDITLADGAENGPHRQITIKGEETLEVHVQVLANGLRVAVPASDTVDHFEGKRVDRRRWG